MCLFSLRDFRINLIKVGIVNNHKRKGLLPFVACWSSVKSTGAGVFLCHRFGWETHQQATQRGRVSLPGHLQQLRLQGQMGSRHPPHHFHLQLRRAEVERCLLAVTPQRQVHFSPQQLPHHLLNTPSKNLINKSTGSVIKWWLVKVLVVGCCEQTVINGDSGSSEWQNNALWKHYILRSC